MDTAEKFIANKTPRVIIIIFLMLTVMSVLISLTVSSKLTDKIVSEQINECIASYGGQKNFFDGPEEQYLLEGSSALKGYGIRNEMDPRIYYSYGSTRKLLFTCMFLPSFLICIFFCISAETAVLKHYSVLEDIRLKCINVAEQKPVAGIMSIKNISSCTGRLDESISLINERISHLTAVLNDDREFLRDFLSDFSHQLKTSVAVLRLNTDLIESMPDMDPEKYEELISENTMHLDSMEDLVLSSLKLAKMNAGSVEYDIQKTNAYDVCCEAVKHVSGLARNKNIKTSVSGNTDIFINADRMWLREAVENIIKNSVDHADCSTVSVTVSESITAVTISVSDDGKGIPQKYIPKLFERFGKSSGSSVMSSTGIGISIAEKIVNAHNGEILIFSEEGKGTSFDIVILK